MVHCCCAGSSLLGRAKQLGPHSFVQLSLFPANEQLEMVVPSLQTSFQAQTFCPDFHFRRQLPVDIDARMIQALATQVPPKSIASCYRSALLWTTTRFSRACMSPAQAKFQDHKGFITPACEPHWRSSAFS